MAASSITQVYSLFTRGTSDLIIGTFSGSFATGFGRMVQNFFRSQKIFQKMLGLPDIYNDILSTVARILFEVPFSLAMVSIFQNFIWGTEVDLTGGLMLFGAMLQSEQELFQQVTQLHADLMLALDSFLRQ